MTFLFSASPNFDQILVQSFLDDLRGCFWARLRFLDLAMRHLEFKWTSESLTQSTAKECVRSIFSSPYIAQVNSDDNSHEVAQRRLMLFSWIKHMFVKLSFPPWGLDFLGVISGFCLQENWSQCLKMFTKDYLVQMALTYSDKMKGLEEYALSTVAQLPLTLHTMEDTRLLQTVLVEDIKCLASINPAYQVNPFVIRTQIWTNLEKFDIDIEPLMLHILSLALKGPYISDTLESVYRKALELVVSKISTVLAPNFKNSNRKWDFWVRMLSFNSVPIQAAALEFLKLMSFGNDLDDAVMYLTQQHPEELEKVIIMMTSDAQKSISDGIVLFWTSKRLIELYCSIGRANYTDINHSKPLKNYWIRFNLLILPILKGSFVWNMQRSIDSSLVRGLFRQCISAIRLFMEYRSTFVSSMSDHTAFHLDWAKDIIHGIKPWLDGCKTFPASGEAEINHMCCTLILEILQVLTEKLKLNLKESWKNSLGLEKGVAKNESLRVKIDAILFKKLEKTYWDDDIILLEPSPKRPSPATDLPLSKHLKIDNHQTNELHESIMIRNGVPTRNEPNPAIKRPIPPAPNVIIPHAIPRSTKGMSTFDKLKLASKIENRSNQLQKPVAPVSQKPVLNNNSRQVPEVPPDEEEEKKKRSIKFIDPPISAPRHRGKPVPVPTAEKPIVKKVSRSVKMQTLYNAILSWKIDDKEALAGFKFRNVPIYFKNFEEYLDIFEPLFLLECKANFTRGVLEAKDKRSSIIQLENMTKVDNIFSMFF